MTEIALPPPQCALMWTPYTKDRTMGLNHQMASLSCVLSEAAFLGRTLLLPDRICIAGQHVARWSTSSPSSGAASSSSDAWCADPAAAKSPGHAPGVSPSSSRSVPIGELFDVGLLSRLVPIELWPAGDDAWLRARYPAARTAAVRGREWPSSRVKREHPCAAARALLVRRSVDNFWFQQCTSHVADTDALSARVNELLGVPQGRKHVNIILRSGLFFARAIKEAAAAVRARIGGTYASVHVRRSDKLSACAPADCKRRDTLTRPAALRSALRRWFPEHSSVYVGSTERPDYCARRPPDRPPASPPPVFSPAHAPPPAQSASSRRRTGSTLPTTSPPSSPT